MLVKIMLRTPGLHREIAKTKMGIVPREGEMVTINDETRIVHSVNWNLTEMSVTILLRE